MKVIVPGKMRPRVRSAVEVQAQRPPMSKQCTCGQIDHIVLPVGHGALTWACKGCEKKWQIVFNDIGGKWHPL